MDLISQNARTVAEVAREFCVQESTVRKWLRAARRAQENARSIPPARNSESLLKRLYAPLAFLFVPAIAVRSFGFYLGWPFLSPSDNFLDNAINWFFVAAFLYYGFVMHVLIDYAAWAKWIRHAALAISVMACALVVETLRSSNLIPGLLAERISEQAVSMVWVKLLDWVVGGVVGNAVYAFISALVRRAKPQPSRDGALSSSTSGFATLGESASAERGCSQLTPETLGKR